MIPWVGAAVLVIVFLFFVRLFGLVEKSAVVFNISRDSLSLIRDATLSDETKEAALKKDARRLLGLFFTISSLGAAAFLIPLGLLWMGDRMGWISLESVFSIAVSPGFLTASGVLTLLAVCLPRSGKSETNRYSFMERTLHRAAFKTYDAQVSLADLEDRLFSGSLAAFQVNRPVFITALPRAGTTLMLEYCTRQLGFAAHCYRDMPFIPVPCLWNRFSGMFQQEGRLRERAHGDGMLIDFDSPEALEEVLWKTSWKRHYQNNRVLPWTREDEDEDFAELFRNHMRKIVFLRSASDPRATRYISKNNLNIARLPVLKRIVPDCTIVVPFRQPLQHAASLLAMHLNFLKIHEQDPFAREYMLAIGHFDFGMNLRPIDFEGWIGASGSPATENLAFWLEYWVRTYRCLLQERDNLFFFGYERLCEDPLSSLFRLMEAVGCTDQENLESAAADIRAPRLRDVDTDAIDSSLLKEADNIHADLMALSRP